MPSSKSSINLPSFTIYTEDRSGHQSGGINSKQNSEPIGRTSPVGKKSPGLSERVTPIEVTETRDMKSRKRSASSKSKNKSQSKQADLQYVERTVSAQAASRWKPLAKVTKQFVLDTLDDAIVNVLNETNPQTYEDVQDTLNILRQRIVGSLSAVTAPPTRVSSQYKQLEDHRHNLELSVAEATKQVQSLEEEIGEHERLVEDKEKMLEDLQAASDKTVGRRRRKLHPIIENNNQLVLGLPKLKGIQAGSKEIKTSSKSSINPHHDQCMDVLQKWQAESSVKDITAFIETSDATDEKEMASPL